MSAIILTPKKIAQGLFFEQLKWTTWFLSFMFVIYIVVVSFFASGPHSSFIDLVNFSNGSTSIYMLILGLLTTSAFFYNYMRQGAARKNFFLGAAISAALLAIAITVILILLAFILQWMSGWTGWDIIHGQESDFTSSFSSAVSIFVKVITMHLIYFLIGWLIGLTFYRAGWLYGLLSIACSLMLVVITGILIEITHFSFFTDITLPIYAALPLSIALIILLYGINYLLIKDVTVKI